MIKKPRKKKKGRHKPGRLSPSAYKKFCEDLFWNRDNGQCSVCGNTNDLEYDHIKSRGQGGKDIASNLKLLCRRCHAKKHGINLRIT
jgi:5-methylcytosine-specific restriction endonuclease McrA